MLALMSAQTPNF